MRTQLDSEWVNKVAAELEPIYRFMGHYWVKQVESPMTGLLQKISYIPTSGDIAGVIHRLWQDLEGYSEIGSGGIYVLVGENGEPVVVYRKEIVFRSE